MKTELYTIIADASDYVVRLFAENLPSDYSFHNTQHTLDVVHAAEQLAMHYDLTDEERFILTVAAWFHDTGYTKQYEGHEQASMDIAEEYLCAVDMDADFIISILGCIRATEVPQSPRNLLEEILCDADLANVGSDTFFEMSARLREEWHIVKGREFTDEEWHDIKFNLCKFHRYHTEAARAIFAPKQAENLAKLTSEFA
jgi:uncharacterized protein